MTADLISRAKSGDRDALAELLNQHDAEIRALVERRIPADCRALISADDVLQETYFVAASNIRTFTPLGDRSFVAWLTRIALRKLALATRALRTIKRRGNGARLLRQGTNSEDALLENLTQLATHATPSRLINRAEALAQLHRAIAHLPEHYQTVIRRHDLDAVPMPDVAAEIKLSLGAAYLLRLRALDALRGFLAGKISNY